MDKYLKYTPFLLWVLYVIYDFNASSTRTNDYSERIKMTNELTDGGIPFYYNLSAYVPFFDELLLLVVACLIYYILVKKHSQFGETPTVN